MLERQYHCLIAGLPDLFFDQAGRMPEPEMIIRELGLVLYPDDFSLVSILLLPYDNLNFLHYLYREDLPVHPMGRYSQDDFDEQKRRLQSILPEEEVLPGYMVRILERFLTEEETPGRLETEKLLAGGFYAAAIGSGNDFLRSWALFDRDMNNLLAAMNYGRLEMDYHDILIGEGDLNEELEKSLLRGKDFVPPQDPEHVGEIFRRASAAGYEAREREMDLMRWNALETMTFFHYFTVEKVLAYLLRLMILDRWKRLDPVTGRKRFEHLVEGMREDALKSFRTAR